MATLPARRLNGAGVAGMAAGIGFSWSLDAV
jgi:hypothetical protein